MNGGADKSHNLERRWLKQYIGLPLVFVPFRELCGASDRNHAHEVTYSMILGPSPQVLILLQFGGGVFGALSSRLVDKIVCCAQDKSIAQRNTKGSHCEY